jgi:hypothetical protein
LSTLRYRCRLTAIRSEAAVAEQRSRQLSLLEAIDNPGIPSEIEQKTLDLLVQLLISVAQHLERDLRNEGGMCDEQDHKQSS